MQIQLISRKNFMLFLAAILVVAMGYMAISLSKRQAAPPTFEQEINKIESQSSADDVNSIEKDLLETDFSDMEKELNDIDAELNQPY